MTSKGGSTPRQPRARLGRAAGPKEGREPLYARIAATLRGEIADGTYPVGSQLPTEDRLCERFSASRHTIRDALRLLRDENLVLSRKKAGTLVAPPQASTSNFVHATSIDDLMTFSKRWSRVIDTIGMARLDPKLAAWVESDPDEEWLTFGCLARSEGAELPECWASYHIHRDYAGLADMITDHEGQYLPLIEQRFGLTITLLVQEFTASLIPPELAAPLQVAAGSAAISVRRMYRTGKGRLVFITVETYPAERFRYTTALHRDGPNKSLPV